MALIKTTLLPHSPLLIPEIGQANYNFLAKTALAYNQVLADLKERGVETLVIISPHGQTQEQAFALNVTPEMTIDLKDFGFIPAKTSFAGDALLADQIKSALRPDFPLQLISEPLVDSGSAIPLYLLKDLAVSGFKIIIISPASVLNLEEHYKFGTRLGVVLRENEKKIAVIASGDLSHRLKRKSPGGYSPKGAKFDNKLIEYLSEPTSAVANVLKMDANLIKDAGECGLKSLVILLGVLSDIKWQPQIMAYQTDFGIGYLSLDLKF